MSAHWKHILNCLISDPIKHDDLLISLYCVIQDYHEKGIDEICSPYQMKQLQRAVIQVDSFWALDEIPNIMRCDRCDLPFIEDDIRPFRHPTACGRLYQTNHYCEECHYMVGRMIQEFQTPEQSDTESDIVEAAHKAGEERFYQMAQSAADEAASEEPLEDKLEREAEWAAEMEMGK